MKPIKYNVIDWDDMWSSLILSSRNEMKRDVDIIVWNSIWRNVVRNVRDNVVVAEIVIKDRVDRIVHYKVNNRQLKAIWELL